jgi:hypothetical protein
MEPKSTKQIIHSDKILSKERQKIVTNANFDLDIHKRYWASIAPNYYEYTKELKDILLDIVKYFNGQPCMYDLGKGLYIHGIFGIGKTTIFDITRQYLSVVMRFNPNAYKISSVEKMLNYFKIENNLDVFGFNVKVDDRGGYKSPCSLLINEFGTEFKYKDIKNYGSPFIEEYSAMLMARNEVFVDYNKLTHCTSNFGLKELSTMYSGEVLDRFVAMFNFIELKGKTFRV